MILYSKIGGACVDTIFGTGRISWGKPIGDRKVIVSWQRDADGDRQIEIVPMIRDDW